MRSFYPIEYIKFNTKSYLNKMIRTIKENIGTIFKITSVIIHALITVFFVFIAYERQQLSIQSQIENINTSYQTQINSLKDYINYNVKSLDEKISLQQENNDRTYQLFIDQNKDITNKLDAIDTRLDKLISERK